MIARRTPLPKVNRKRAKQRAARRNDLLQNYVRGRGCCLHWLSPRSHRCQGKVEFAHYPHTKAQRLPDKGIGLCSAAHTGSRGLDTIGRVNFRLYWKLNLDALDDEATRNSNAYLGNIVQWLSTVNPMFPGGEG